MSFQEITFTQCKCLPDMLEPFPVEQTQEIQPIKSFLKKPPLSQPWTVMYFHLRLKTFSGNEQQPSEIICNGLEIDLPPQLCSHIRELCTVYNMCTYRNSRVLGEFYYVATIWSYKHAWIKLKLADLTIQHTTKNACWGFKMADITSSHWHRKQRVKSPQNPAMLLSVPVFSCAFWTLKQTMYLPTGCLITHKFSLSNKQNLIKFIYSV